MITDPSFLGGFLLYNRVKDATENLAMAFIDLAFGSGGAVFLQ